MNRQALFIPDKSESEDIIKNWFITDTTLTSLMLNVNYPEAKRNSQIVFAWSES